MATQILGSVILWLIALAVIVVIAVYLLRWLYRRSIKETAFVRTGFGGEKVVINGGAFVIPVLHEMTPVNMNVMRVEVRRAVQKPQFKDKLLAAGLEPPPLYKPAEVGGYIADDITRWRSFVAAVGIDKLDTAQHQ